MAYFSNGTQMDLFSEAHCTGCTHLDEDGLCPVMDAHFFFMSDAIKAGEDSPGMNILNLLISEDEETLMPNRCHMRTEK